MSLVTIDHHPSDGQLRTFSLCWLVFLGAWSGWAGWRGGGSNLAWTLGLLAVAVPLMGLAWREGLRRLYVGMCYATWPIGVVVSYVVLATVYFLVLTPIAMAMRLAGYDPLERKWDREAGGYWVQRPPPPPPEQYFRQY